MESNRDDLESPKPLPLGNGGSGPSPGTKGNAEVRYIMRDIFQIAYDPNSFSLLSPLFAKCLPLSWSVFRYLGDMWRLSKWHSLNLYLWMVLKTLVPSLSLYFGSLVFFDIDDLLRGNAPRMMLLEDLRFHIVAWLLCGLLSYQVEVTLTHLRAELGGRLRAYFHPKLVKAVLEFDLSNTQDGYKLPGPDRYGEDIPGWNEILNIACRLTSFLVIIFEMLTMVVIVSCFEDRFDVYMMPALIVSFLVAIFLLPRNGAGGGGYTYWTTNGDYHKLMALFHITFDPEYRSSAIKDGLVNLLVGEYKAATARLGPVKADTWILDWNLLPSWHWGIPRFLMLSYPMALCSLFSFWSSSLRTIGITMIIFQYGVFTMNESIRTLEAEGTEGLDKSFKQIVNLYDTLDMTPAAQNVLDFLGDVKSTGMKVELQNVSYKYKPTSVAPPELVVPQLSIQPGQLVVIAGTNGSGKSTLANVISGLVEPSSGDVFINGTNSQNIDDKKFRQATAFVGQKSEVIYPVSLRENLLFGLTSKDSIDLVTKSDLERAVSLGGAQEVIKKHGFNMVLNPPSITAVGLRHPPGTIACEALRKKGPYTRQTELSTGEYQRIFASRAFMRLNHEDIKMIILDESTNALDPIAESEVLDNFRTIAREKGQTMIVVTHRLARVAKHADLILCMREGKIYERGTHEELMANEDLYHFLYMKQAFASSPKTK